jgi:hypothetical protein
MGWRYLKHDAMQTLLSSRESTYSESNLYRPPTI